MKIKFKKSKLFSEAEYVAMKAVLLVTLKNGKKYAFKGIDHSVFHELKNKNKPAKFIKKKIIGTYLAKRIKN